MTGWTKVILATAVMAVALIGLNISIWRRLRRLREQEGPAADANVQDLR